ncbi:MAG: hypothetical protein KKG00_08810, partial [Bacteroidetes bacterium]|nr:hypothetical protein [Bacteroidota bacterium]
MHICKKILGMILGGWLLTGTVLAQNSPKNVTASPVLTLGSFADCVFTQGNISVFPFTSPTDHEYGIIRDSFLQVTIKTTVDWILSVRARDPFFDGSGGGTDHVMPPSIIGVRRSGENTYTNVTTTNQMFTS